MPRFRKVLHPLAVALLVVTSGAAAEEGPRQAVQKLVEAVRSYKDTDNGALTPAEKASNLQAAQAANSSLAIREVSRSALGGQWDKLSAAEQKRFVDLITQLFEKVAYPKSSTFFEELEVEYKKERISGDRATVATSVRHPKEGLVLIDYRLRQDQSRWVIYDIVLDEVSLAADLRSQMQKILREESYARLLQRLREKLDES